MVSEFIPKKFVEGIAVETMVHEYPPFVVVAKDCLKISLVFDVGVPIANPMLLFLFENFVAII